ncbi:MAG: hypothetical protein A3F26_01690 [Candidatus Ryanbacteria bacterium RIFCSPHIGHO2_12_FULL_47_12b]|uniref:DUF4145 domain-containing protein n=2 Tax=Candidatus Ryaniibacteriota TaxID=1817914 RepID=A0A1G2H770_9BACT|nr:MAG: hypothetical protein UX74_C0027G0015 [Parcubacteria group bacterium GW2011_GWA2_47_10b]OGZ45587.1 MAG: hypothetical protein A2844_01185 [Candidatus Ryanbacteria bacterium RIFCSPHIGHO2_01_FULL_48_80]OGZ49962.1 MAG: hypothetical protein A3C83_01810 [Candidatus Ryanbacteria bacterium RIFCSPHIGHO2_02_FULL_47_25]OGZ51620.1 MAG: hypothetical protein A3F26_01690 [Candidatus Ryanbacteria bacterium RIFCSPHIGHO2_12_FULL_47_12b]OGZ52326.1 MAG: hypothetical protein A3A29_01535 [Candidatus Ryanbacte
MAEAPKTQKTQTPPPSPQKRSGPDQGDEFDLVIIILIIIFLVLSFSGAVVESSYNIARIPFIYNTILVLKVISGSVGVLSLIGIGYVVSHLRPYRIHHGESDNSFAYETALPETKSHAYAYEWNALKNRLEMASDADAALIIIDADALADRILQEAGLPGETMGDRLIALGEQKFKNIDDFWMAHKVRNQIAHGGTGGVTYSDALYALERYERAFKELDVI